MASITDYGPLGTADDAPVINKAIAAVVASGHARELEFPDGQFNIGSTLNFPLDMAQVWNIEGKGAINAGTWFQANENFNGTSAVSLLATGPVTTSFRLKNIGVTPKTPGMGPRTGMSIGGSTGASIGNFHQSLVENVFVHDFAQGLDICNTRNVKFDRCSAWTLNVPNSTPFVLRTEGSGAFSGDMDFCNSQAVAPDDSGVTFLVNSKAGGNSGVSGVAFNRFQFYGGHKQLDLQCGAASGIADLWLNPGCQFEGRNGNHYALTAFANGAGAAIRNLHVVSTYMAGAGFVNQVNMLAMNGGALVDVKIINNYMSNTKAGYSFVDIKNTGGVMQNIDVSGNTLRDIGGRGEAGIVMDGISGASACDNKISGSQKIYSIVCFKGGGDYIKATGNNSQGLCTGPLVLNASSAAHTMFSLNQ